MSEIKFAPKEIFEQMLEYMVIPTFDLILEYNNEGIILVKRKIAPYKNQWALPGLRMYKGENIDDTLKRIAEAELGIKIDPKNKIFLGQYIGKFTTEHNRQDISTGYYLKVKDCIIKPNEDHFYSHQITKTIPKDIGAMYKYYLNQYQKLVKQEG